MTSNSHSEWHADGTRAPSPRKRGSVPTEMEIDADRIREMTDRLDQIPAPLNPKSKFNGITRPVLIELFFLGRAAMKAGSAGLGLSAQRSGGQRCYWQWPRTLWCSSSSTEAPRLPTSYSTSVINPRQQFTRCSASFIVALCSRPCWCSRRGAFVRASVFSAYLRACWLLAPCFVLMFSRWTSRMSQVNSTSCGHSVSRTVPSRFSRSSSSAGVSLAKCRWRPLRHGTRWRGTLIRGAGGCVSLRGTQNSLLAETGIRHAKPVYTRRNPTHFG